MRVRADEARGAHRTEKSVASAGLLGLAFLVPLALFWGFSVDDAWIIARVVLRGVTEGSFAFHEVATDAVTPILFPYFAGGIAKVLGCNTVESIFSLLRALGVAATIGIAIVFGYDFQSRARMGARVFGTRFAIVAATGCLGAYASSGLETSVVAFLFYCGSRPITGRRSPIGYGCLGLAFGMRPELLFAAVAVLAFDFANAKRSEFLASVAVFVCTAGGSVLVRLVRFGTLVPLSFEAKAPNFELGLRYGLGGLVFSGSLFLVCLVRRERRVLVGTVVLAHLLAIVLAGGDWMPLYRLFVPLLPTLVHEACLGVEEGRWPKLFFSIFVAATSFVLVFYFGADSRAVVGRRQELMRRGRPALAGAKNVAAVDVGWVGAVHPGAVTDLGGVTDPKIGKLLGGHTSKHVSIGLFGARGVDAYVVRDASRAYSLGRSLEDIVPVYDVDRRLLPGAIDVGFVVVATFPIEGTRGQYLVLRDRSGQR